MKTDVHDAAGAVASAPLSMPSHPITYDQQQSYQSSAMHVDGFSCQREGGTHNSAAHPTRRPHHSGPSRT